MDKKIIDNIWATWQEVAMNEKRKLDPVDDKANDKKFKDRKDKDIDNDGDVDSSDEFLHKKRKAIDNEIDGGEKPADNAKPKKGVNPFAKKEAVKESDDEMEDCPQCEGSTVNHDDDCPRAEASNKKKLKDDMDKDSSRKALKHDCASHVTSESWGFGECITGEHTLVEQEDGTGVVSHYDVMFEHGLEKNVPVETLTIVREKSHLHAAKKVKEGKTHAERTKNASKEGPLDKFKGSAGKDMAKDNNVNDPKHAEITPEEEGHKDSVKAGRVTKQAPARAGDNRKGDLKPVKGVK